MEPTEHFIFYNDLLGEGNLYANSKTAAASVIKKAKMNE
jgi:hypothetical protein